MDSFEDIHFSELLPPEIWSIITSYLDLWSLQSLWLARDHALQLRLKHGGVCSITFTHTSNQALEWPFGPLKQFPTLQEVNFSFSPNVYIAASELTLRHIQSLPPSIKKLALGQKWIHMRYYRTRQDDIGKMLAALPKQLTSLEWPCTVDSSNISNLPTNITDLTLHSSRMDDFELLPPNLTSLSFRPEGNFGADNFRYLPRDLKKLDLLFNALNFGMGNSFVNALPPHLTYFGCAIEIMSFGVRNLESLPSTLQVLKLPNTKLLIDDNTRIDREYGRIKFPQHLTELHIASFPNSLTPISVKSLPNSLRTLIVTDAGSWSHRLIADLPQGLTELSLKKAHQLTNLAVGDLPRGLKRLVLMHARIGDPCLSRLPTELEYLETGRARFSENSYQQLPATVTEWKNENLRHFKVPLLTSFIVFDDDPNIWRRAAWYMQRKGVSREYLFKKALMVALGYYFVKRSSDIVPRLPTIISNMLLSYRTNLATLALGLLYALR